MPRPKKKYLQPAAEATPKIQVLPTIVPQFLTVQQAAVYLSATVASTRRWIKKHKLRCVKIGKRFTYSRDDINATWMKVAA